MRISSLVAALSIVCASHAVADGWRLEGATKATPFPAEVPVAQYWGVDDAVVTTYLFTDMQPAVHDLSYETNPIAGLVPVGTGFFPFIGSVELETGVQLLGFLVTTCDSDAAEDIDVGFFAENSDFSGTGIPVALQLAPDGCGTFPLILPSPLTISNLDKDYMLVVQMKSSQHSVRSYRAVWQRQVAPAPATATFNDVPTTHPYFQFVEALAASGITAGTGAGSYSPDQPVTRGQLAVFLAKALGLHWPEQGP